MEITICRTITGEPLGVMEAASASGTRSGDMLDPGEATFTFQLEGDGRPASETRDLLAPKRRTLVAHENGEVIWAGTSETYNYKPHTGALTIKAREIGSYANTRMLYGIGRVDRPDWKFVNRSRRGIAIESVLLALNGSDAGNWNLPIVVPESEPGPYTVTYSRRDSLNLADWLKAQAPGIELDLRPVWAQNEWLVWILDAGSPGIERGVVEVNAHAEETPLVGYDQNGNATRLVTGLVALGEGSGPAMKRAEASSVEMGGLQAWDMPFNDATVPMKNIKDTPTLRNAALRELERRYWPIETIDFDWQPSEKYARLQPNWTVKVMGEDPWNGKYEARRRVLKTGWDSKSSIQKLTLGAARG